jgi:hypothetical protein
VETVAGAGEGAVSGAGACATDEAGAELTADWSGAAALAGESCAVEKMQQDKKRRSNPELEQLIRIRTFREF